MLFLNAEDIRKIFTVRDAIESNREAFVLQAQGHVALPVRTNFAIREGDISSFMPACATSYPLAGIKIVSTYASNATKNLPAVNATVLLLDPETGATDALLDGTELTRLRTGAVSGLATELLANADAQVGALFGTGGQAAMQAEAMLAVRPLREIRVFDVDPARAADFIRRTAPLAERCGARFIAASSPAAAVDGADVITTVTTSARPVFDGSLAKPGAHINAVGAFQPHKRELDGTLVTRADRIFIDNWEACMAEAGDLLIPMREGGLAREDIAGELGELILGRVPGRTDNAQITLMKTVGFGTLDIVAAHRALRKAVEAGVGTLLE